MSALHRGLAGGTLVVALALASVFGWRAVRAHVRGEVDRGFDLQTSSYAGSAACRACHPDHHASWARTFHRTMTVDVDAAHSANVLAPFDGRPYRYGSVTARALRDEAGRFWMTFTADDNQAHPVRVEVSRAVGSHRAQQYFTRLGAAWFRLPMAYHVEERRWLHMNGAFLTADPALVATSTWPVASPSSPPPPPPPPSDDGRGALPSFGGSFRDYDRHVTRWNDNCIFCHNVRPNPGWDVAEATFASTTAELGIACESCHGPGAEHAARNRNPLRRYGLRDTGVADPTIVNPARLSPGRAADVCGRCHGQRITDDVGKFLAHGDPFVAGEDLGLYSAPLWATTSLGDDRVFAPRFWDDGTPRLTAYEYQGWLQSACSQRGSLTCTSCHGMHDGAPAGQLRPRAEGDGACQPCHGPLVDTSSARAAHAGKSHAAVACVDCHMPRIVYGVMDVLRSHRIEIPEPARAAATGRPDACRLCHVSRDAAWAVAHRAALGTRREPGPVGPSPPHDGDSSAGSLSTLALALGGDPLSRAVAAAALGRFQVDDGSSPREARLALLHEVMRTDPYPSVRRIAARAASQLWPEGEERLRAFDPTGPAGDRRRALEAWARDVPSLNTGPRTALVRTWVGDVTALRRAADTAALDIGE